MDYPIRNGRVETRALEYHVADHCNLRCDHCCSYSPLLKRWTADPVEFERDLRAVGRAVAPEFLKIVGGEPLLHPELERLLAMARALGVGRRLQLTTNGFLIERLSANAWDMLDVLTVSLYPEPSLPKDRIRFIAREARKRNVAVSWKVQDRFSCLDRDAVAGYAEAKEIFNACWIRQRCHSVKHGRFFTCTRPQYVQRFATERETYLQDGVEVHEPDGAALALRIQSYLQRTEPLTTCFLCNGGNAPMQTHRQLSPFAVREKRDRMVHLSEVAAASR